MHILLDEYLPRNLKRALAEHHVVTVPEQGWASIKNGALLRLAEPIFEVFITADQICNINKICSPHSLALSFWLRGIHAWKRSFH